MGRGHLDGLVQVPALQDIEADDPLVRLGERTIGHQHLATAAADRRRGSTGPQPVAGDPPSGRLVGVDPGVGVQGPLVGLVRIRVRVRADQHQVLHRVRSFGRWFAPTTIRIDGIRQ
jgi:hypothetical protein